MCVQPTVTCLGGDRSECDIDLLLIDFHLEPILVLEEWGQLGLPWASLVVQRVKHLPAMWDTWVLSPGREDPLEKEMATHSSTLAWKIPGCHSFLP